MPGIKYPLPHVPMLGKGSILFDRFDASGLLTGYMPFGNCTKFELAHKDERAELFQSLNKSASLIATGLKKRTVSVSIIGTDFRSDMLALSLMSTPAQAAGWGAIVEREDDAHDGSGNRDGRDTRLGDGDSSGALFRALEPQRRQCDRSPGPHL